MAERITKSEIVRFLADIGAFELLSREHLAELAELVTVRRLKKEEILWLQGRQVTYFSIVYSGRIRTVRQTSEGSEKAVSVLGRGLHFGLAEMITGSSSALTLKAMEPTVILTMDHKSLRRKLLNNPEITYRLMGTMARAIFSLTRELERASFEAVPTRLARQLLKNQEASSNSQGGHKQAKEITHEQLAQQLGVSRETISRVLAQFRREGLIKTGYRRITILNGEGLMSLVEDFDQW